MNRKNRYSLKSICMLLDNIRMEINNLLEDEEEKMFNYPENLQSSEAYENMEGVVDAAYDAISYIDEIIDSFEEFV